MVSGFSEQMAIDVNRTIAKLSLDQKQTIELEQLLLLTKQADDLEIESTRNPVETIEKARLAAIQSLCDFHDELRLKSPVVLQAFHQIQEISEEQRNLY